MVDWQNNAFTALRDTRKFCAVPRKKRLMQGLCKAYARPTRDRQLQLTLMRNSVKPATLPTIVSPVTTAATPSGVPV